MELKWMAVGALALIPCAAMAQAKTSDSMATRRDTSTAHRDTSQPSKSASQQTTTSTSTGEVSGGNAGANVTQTMIEAQSNANLIGSPAWWKNHGTADGKPPIQRSGTSH
jgi:hypothetical protein